MSGEYKHTTNNAPDSSQEQWAHGEECAGLLLLFLRSGEWAYLAYGNESFGGKEGVSGE